MILPGIVRGNDGSIGEFTIDNQGSYYRDVPTIEIESPGINANASAVVDSSGIISSVMVEGVVNEVNLSRGSGYTEAPTVTIGSSGTPAAATASVSGIGTIQNIVAIPDIDADKTFDIQTHVFTKTVSANNNREWIEISAPSAGNRAEAYVQRTSGVFDRVVMVSTGSGYTLADNIIVTHYYYKDALYNTTTSHFIAKIDAIGAISLSVNGTGYDSNNPPNINIARSGTNIDGIDAVATVQIDTTNALSSLLTPTVIFGGSGYDVVTVTIDPPGARAHSELTLGIVDVLVGGFDTISITSGGTGYSKTDSIVFTNGTAIEGNYIEPKGYLNVNPTDGSITGICLTRYGNGYATPPTVSIVSSSGGTGFSAGGIVLKGAPGNNYSQNSVSLPLTQKTIQGLGNKLYVEGMTLTQGTSTATVMLNKQVNTKHDEVLINITSGTFNNNDSITISDGSIQTGPFVFSELLKPIISNNKLIKVLIRNSGYFTSEQALQNLTASGLGGDGSAFPVIGNTGKIKNISMTTSGINYTTRPSVSISAPKVNASVALQLSNNSIKNVKLTRGTGYTDIPSITPSYYDYISSTPVYNPRVLIGSVDKIIIKNKGTGYTSAASLSFSAPETPTVLQQRVYL